MPTLLSTDIRREMDHYILALARDGSDDRPDVMVSLYWIPWTTEGGAPLSGHLAWLWVSGQDGSPPVARLFTDSLELAAALVVPTRPGRWAAEVDAPIAELATFERRADGPLAMTWLVTAANGTVLEARWWSPGTPIHATGQSRDGVSHITTLLVSEAEASVALDGVLQPGRPYPEPIWTPWFGAEQTSCVIGLGETIFRPHP